MKKYTQEEFNAIKRNPDGVKSCPTGDYTAVKSFEKWCSFGEQCSFGEWCSFEKWRIKNSDYFACDRIGSEKRKTYFFKSDGGYFVRAGFFFGTLDDFVALVKVVHAGTKLEREYLAAAELAKIVLE